MADTVKTTVTELPESRVRVAGARSRPRRSSAASSRPRASSAARCACPGFRKGKVPPPVVIRRLGREAVLDEALRSALGELVRRRDRRGRDRARRRARARRSERASRGGTAASVLDRDRRAPGGQARRVQGTRGRPPRAPRRGAADRRGDRAAARPAGDARDRRAPRRERRPRRDRLRRHRRRRAVRGRRGARPAARARLGPAHPRVRGAAGRARAPATSGP